MTAANPNSMRDDSSNPAMAQGALERSSSSTAAALPVDDGPTPPSRQDVDALLNAAYKLQITLEDIQTFPELSSEVTEIAVRQAMKLARESLEAFPEPSLATIWGEFHPRVGTAAAAIKKVLGVLEATLNNPRTGFLPERPADNDEPPQFNFLSEQLATAIRTLQEECTRVKQAATPPVPPVTAGASASRQEQPPTTDEPPGALVRLEPAVEKAHLAYLFAVEKRGRPLTDADAYEFLVGYFEEQDDLEAREGEKKYELPAFETFRRQVTEARRLLDKNKYVKRSRGTTGRSIVRPDQVESSRGRE